MIFVALRGSRPPTGTMLGDTAVAVHPKDPRSGPFLRPRAPPPSPRVGGGEVRWRDPPNGVMGVGFGRKGPGRGTRTSTGGSCATPSSTVASRRERGAQVHDLQNKEPFSSHVLFFLNTLPLLLNIHCYFIFFSSSCCFQKQVFEYSDPTAMHLLFSPAVMVL